MMDNAREKSANYRKFADCLVATSYRRDANPFVTNCAMRFFNLRLVISSLKVRSRSVHLAYAEKVEDVLTASILR